MRFTQSRDPLHQRAEHQDENQDQCLNGCERILTITRPLFTANQRKIQASRLIIVRAHYLPKRREVHTHGKQTSMERRSQLSILRDVKLSILTPRVVFTTKPTPVEWPELSGISSLFAEV